MNVQLYPVLDKQVCRKCLDDTNAFLETPPVNMDDGNRKKLSEQAFVVASINGTVSAKALAAANGEPVRRVYFRLMKMAERGKLRHRGDGVFELPRRWSGAAE
jgi:hypothetical protein